MKILFISKYLTLNDKSESRLGSLINYFSKKKNNVTVISSNNFDKNNIKKTTIQKTINGVDYFFLKDIQLSNLNFQKTNKAYSIVRVLSWLLFEYRVYKFNYNLLNYKPEIIYISSLSLLTIINGIFLKKKFKAKLVFEMRDLCPYFFYTTKVFSKYNPLIAILSIIEKIGIKNSDLIIGLVPEIKKYIEFRGFKKKTLASTFPVNLKLFKNNSKNKLVLNKSKFNICYAGNFGFDNHLDILLDLISKINNKNYFFHFIGNGSQKNKLVKKYSKFRNIKFYNMVKFNCLHSYLLQMDSFILSFGFQNEFQRFGYELNKLNNYIMAKKPVIILGSKKNLSKKRGEFLFVQKNNLKLFKNNLYKLKKNYPYYLKIAKENKNKLLIRNNIKKIYYDTFEKINNL